MSTILFHVTLLMSVTNIIFILASTSMPKLLLSLRPNLMPFPSKEIANVTKCHQQPWCHQQLWPSSKCNHALVSQLLICDLYIYSGKIHYLKKYQKVLYFFLLKFWVDSMVFSEIFHGCSGPHGNSKFGVGQTFEETWS